MEMIKKNGHIFKVKDNAHGVRLIYLGHESDPVKQFIAWLCDDMREAEDMMDAVIDPNRYAEDEYRARHQEEVYADCKW